MQLNDQYLYGGWYKWWHDEYTIEYGDEFEEFDWDE